MKTLFALAFSLFLASFAQAAYTPPVQRYDATWFQGHNGALDESATRCNLDITLLFNKPGVATVMLVLWSDYNSHISFKPQIPTSLMPLQEGARWTDSNGRGYSYQGGVLATDDGQIRYEIDGRFLFPVKAEGNIPGVNGGSGTYLKCEF